MLASQPVSSVIAEWLAGLIGARCELQPTEGLLEVRPEEG